MRNGLSVDVEDWFQVGAFEGTIDRADWPTLDCRVEANCDAVLALFADAGVQGTFFTLGWVAERYPALIRRIVAAGHELASHGYDHARVFTLDAARFAADLKKSRAILEDAGGTAITGYRAPSFSIDTRTPWAHAVLAEQGYAYSSSVAPVVHDHYGWAASPRHGWRPLPDVDLVEWPVTTARFAGRSLAAGGGFMRILPYGVTHWALSQMNGEGHPAILYFHPWEIDPGQPRVASAPLRSKLRHYTGLSAMSGKLARLLSDFEWGRVDALAADLAQQAPVWRQAA
jgi:polysaccharide deacetylase family protein (PEP-CTERM system associated)